MRLLPASLALLGVEVAMAAIIPPQQAENASPTRPRAPGQLQETRRIAQAEPTATATDLLKLQLLGHEEERLEQQQRQRQQQQRQEAQPQVLNLDPLWHQEAKRQNPITSHSPLPSTASFSSASAAQGPVTTELAFFTAGGGVYSVSSLDGGLEAVAGKTLVVGGPGALVGGEEVTAARSGLMVNGVEVEYQTVTISYSVSGSGVAMSGSMSAMASGSASASAVASQSTTAGNGGAAMPRAMDGVGMMAAVGAVAGILVL